MIEIIKQMCPEDRYWLKCPYTRSPRFVVMHNTANDAPAENEVSYMLRRDEEISFHYAADHEKAIQCLPESRNAWASGDGNGEGNLYGIHIEICWSLSGGERFEKSERNGAALAAGILKRYGWGLDRVRKHQDFDGKYCPHRTLDLGWQRFLDMVKTFLKEDDEMTAAEVKRIVDEALAGFEQRLGQERAARNPVYGRLEDVPAYWRDELGRAMELGIVKGNGRELGLTATEVKAAVMAARAYASGGEAGEHA